MTFASRERLQVTAPIFLVSGGAWLLLALKPMNVVPVSHCSFEIPVGASLRGGLLSLLNLYASFSMDWVGMLAAMMLPLLIAPVRHIRDESFARRRARSILFFGASYATLWTATGLILMIVAQGFWSAIPDWRMRVLFGIFLALLWQFSPAKQRCLNRGHVHPDLPAFGWAADAAALRFGCL